MALEDSEYYSLRVAYRLALLNQITIKGDIIPVYAGKRQISSTAKMYILIEAQSSADSSTKATSDSSTLVQLSIFCQGAELVGNEHEDIAAQVMQIIAPHPGYKLPINDNFQNVGQTVITNQIMPVRVGNTIEPAYEQNIIIRHDINHLKRSLI